MANGSGQNQKSNNVISELEEIKKTIGKINSKLTSIPKLDDISKRLDDISKCLEDINKKFKWRYFLIEVIISPPIVTFIAFIVISYFTNIKSSLSLILVEIILGILLIIFAIGFITILKNFMDNSL